MENLEKVNRVEVINHADGSGRAYVYWPEDKNIKVEAMIQDDGRTLKIFITEKKND